MARILRALVLPILVSITGTGAAQVAPEAAETAGSTAPATTLLEFGTRDGRMTVPVTVSGSGPYRFVIDTGAERTVISRDLATDLGLAPGPVVTLSAMSGTAAVGTVLIPSLKASALPRREDIHAPALSATDLGAHGLLGLDSLAGNTVTIDFDEGVMSVRPSSRKRRHAERGEIVIRAKSLRGQLVITDAYYDNHKIAVIVDTGASTSVGNLELQKLVAEDSPEMIPLVFTSVLGEPVFSQFTMVPQLRIGDAVFSSLPVAFAEAEPFARLGLDDRPAMLLGMDAMRAFERVQIDFANRQIRFLFPRDIYRRWRDPTRWKTARFG